MELITLKVEIKSLDRLDKYIADNTDLSRSMVQKLAKEGQVLLNNKVVKPSTTLKNGDLITITRPEPQKIELIPENLPIEVLYEDKYLLVINKPQGMVVHPSKGHDSGTLVHGLLQYCTDLSGIGGEIRPGIVHRLDKDTSGLLLVAKNDETHKKLSKAIEKHEVERVYVALVTGKLDVKEGTINAPIARHPVKRVCMAVVPNGREAITHFKVLKTFAQTSFVRLKLETGRTHQIRVHLAYLGHPVVGDIIYNPKTTPDESLMLHAAYLRFVHPVLGKEIKVISKLPDSFRATLQEVFNS